MIHELTKDGLTHIIKDSNVHKSLKYLTLQMKKTWERNYAINTTNGLNILNESLISQSSKNNTEESSEYSLQVLEVRQQIDEIQAILYKKLAKLEEIDADTKSSSLIIRNLENDKPDKKNILDVNAIKVIESKTQKELDKNTYNARKALKTQEIALNF